MFTPPRCPNQECDAFASPSADFFVRNGWVNIHNPGADFEAFLVNQEKEIKDLMTKLGFL